MNEERKQNDKRTTSAVAVTSKGQFLRLHCMPKREGTIPPVTNQRLFLKQESCLRNSKIVLFQKRVLVGLKPYFLCRDILKKGWASSTPLVNVPLTSLGDGLGLLHGFGGSRSIGTMF